MEAENSEIMQDMNQTPARRLTLRKEEKLRHRRLVGDLFTEGKSIYDFPLRLVWRRLSDEELENSFRAEIPDRLGRMQMLITVPKKKRRHAVDRVLMRRRIREAYRLNRLPLADVILSDERIATVSMAFIYLSDQNADYATIEKKMKNLLRKLSSKLSSTERIC